MDILKVITGRRENKFVVGSFSFRGARVAQLDSARCVRSPVASHP